MKTIQLVRLLAVGILVTALAVGLIGCRNMEPGSQAERRVVVGSSVREPNWNMTIGSNGLPQLDGFMIDLWREIGRRNHWEIEFIRADFDALWGMLDAGEIDSLGENASVTPPRMIKYRFSEPFYEDHSVFIYQRDLGSAADLSFFHDRHVAVGAPNSSAFIFKRLNEEEHLMMEAVYQQKESDVVPAVVRGEAEAGLADASTVRIALKEDRAPISVYDPMGPVLSSALPFRQTERGRRLARDASSAVLAMKKDGTLRQLAQRWLYDDLHDMTPSFWLSN